MKKYNAKDKIAGLVIVLFLIFITLFIIQKTTKPKKFVIGVLNPNPELNDVIEVIKNELTGYGYIEGKNVTYISVFNAKDIAPAIQDFKAKKVDLVLSFTTPATLAAKKAMEGSGIPVVFGASYDPVKSGIVANMVYHEENITGIKVGGSEPKALEWLLKIAPDAKRIFVPVRFDTEATSMSLDELKKAAAKMEIDFIISKVETPRDLKAALSSIPEDVGAIFLVRSFLILSNMDMIVKAAIKQKLPTGGALDQYNEGMTITYTADRMHMGKQTSRLMGRILQGAPASSLPVETSQFFLGINLKTAAAMGLEIPNDILVQADFIVR